MTVESLAEPTVESVQSLLRDALAQGDAILSTATPFLRQLLAREGDALFSDEVVARTRGLLADMASQLLDALAEALATDDLAPFAGERGDLAMALADEAGVLAHVHALAIEGTLALRLEALSGLDTVLCPLLKALMGSHEEGVAGTATAVLAAQTRFVLHHRRMTLPLGELPGDVFVRALGVLQRQMHRHADAAVAAARNLRARFDESHGRLALMAQLVARMGDTAPALDLAHAGLSLFATALAGRSAQPRDLCVLSLADGRYARLAVTLRQCGLTRSDVAAQLLQLDADAALPEGFDTLSPEAATRLLAATSPGG